MIAVIVTAVMQKAAAAAEVAAAASWFSRGASSTTAVQSLTQAWEPLPEAEEAAALGMVAAAAVQVRMLHPAAAAAVVVSLLHKGRSITRGTMGMVSAFKKLS
jgi:hypothetical protein